MTDTTVPAFPSCNNNDMSFRLVFPEFADKNVYPEPTLAFWAMAAMTTMNAERWGDWYGLGLYLYVAHNLLLAGQSAKNAAGAAVGLMSNKSVGDVSVGFSVDGVLDKDAGPWNRTLYGQRYWQLLRTVGAGPIQIGTGNYPMARGPGFSLNAWAGPPLWSGWYGST